ncbi:MAG TPA: ATP-dependent metallopeptidase FtsH/Yme1/Tma family protein, partial [Acidimicrobiales bacterium]|nr:ATP-dependent metallopeptidase FtsH/Yme1/Tma family protein [Acidimicrobiales bacterium]
MTPPSDGRGTTGNGGAPGNRGTSGNGAPRPVHHFPLFWIVLIVLLLVNWGAVLMTRSAGQPRITVPFSPYFLSQVKAGDVKSISSTGNTIDGSFTHKLRYPSGDRKATPTTLFSTEVPSFWNYNELTQLLQSKGVQVNAQSTSTGTSVWEEVL